MEGPLVAGKNWMDDLDFTPNTVYRSGFLSSRGEICANDVLYYSKSMRTVWAYTGKVTGIYQAASPTATSPTSVTVAGKTYAVETAAASYALSTLGTHHVGDQVTLLLGKDGGVAAVLDAANVSAVLYGVVTSTGTGTYTDTAGNSYTQKTVTFTATDGLTYTYPRTGYTPSVDSLIQVTVSDSGEVKVSSASQRSISGKVDADATVIGKYEFAPNAEIIDVRSATEILRIYPTRLAGVNLTKEMVRFYATDTAGRITHLILDDVTGDFEQYGILTSLQDLSTPLNVSALYHYNIGGQASTVLLDVVYYVQPGPFSLRSDGYMRSLTGKVALTGLSGTLGYDQDGDTWKLAENVQVFLYDKGYSYASLGYVSEGYKLTGYYDKSISKGGCIRVIVAEPLD